MVHQLNPKYLTIQLAGFIHSHKSYLTIYYNYNQGINSYKHIWYCFLLLDILFLHSTWSFQLAIRRYSHDGHVITFPSNDVSLSLFIEGGNLKWYLIGQSDGSNASSTGMFVSTHVWHELV